MLKRLTILAALGAAALPTAGCGLEDLLILMTDCAFGQQCTGVVESASAARVAAWSKAQGTAQARPFRVAFRGRSVGDGRAVRSGATVFASNRARGRFSGSVAGTLLDRRFQRGRWSASAELEFDPATRTATGRGTVLLRFRDRRAGSVCLYTTVTRARRANGALRETGSITPIGGTGLGARLAGTARFTSRSGEKRGRMRGRSRIGLIDRPSVTSSCGSIG
jgi:hypothetical protein